MSSNSQVKQITIISGKGGVGKSSLAAALAYVLKEEAILADADVDAPDLYLIYHPEIVEKFEYVGSKKAFRDEEKCTYCYACKEACRFDAINDELFIDPVKCEGCGLCYHVCPENAIIMKEVKSGDYMISNTRIGTMVHAKLIPGEENSGKLVAEVRKKAVEVAEKQRKKLVIVDGSPGIGCPVISSLTGADMAIVVTEPTVSGEHDMARIIELIDNFRIPYLVVINRATINMEITQKIQNNYSCKAKKVFVIPHNEIFVKAMIESKTVLELEATTEEEKKIQEKIKEIGSLIKTFLIGE